MSAAYFVKDVATYKPRNVAQRYIVNAIEKLNSITIESKEDLTDMEAHMMDICATAEANHPNCVPAVIDKQIDCINGDILYSIHTKVTTRSVAIANLIICRVRGSWKKGDSL